MSRFGHACIALILALGFACLGSADDNLKTIHTAQRATALVVLPGGKGFASSFCIDANGFFVTSAHVVTDLAAGARLLLVMNSGEVDEKVIQATSARVDKENDLAILKAEGVVEGLTMLPLGASDKLVETQQVVALGYPFGKLLALERAAYPSVSVNVARISSMRKSKGKLELIQLDSQLNPGNSGGPVIDEKGAVIGIVSAGVRAAGINFAVPVNKLTALLERPELAFTPPVIAANQRHAPVELTIRAATFGKPQPDMTVEVILSAADGSERSFPAIAGGPQTYTARVVPVPPTTGPTRYPVEITFTDGSIRCSVEDAPVQLDGKTFMLSRLSSIEMKEGRKALTARDGLVTSGAVLTMQPLKVSFGNFAMPLDAAKAVSIVIREPRQESAGVTYRILAKSKGVVLAETKGTLIAAAAAADRPIGVATSGRPATKPTQPVAVAGPLPEGNGEWIDLIPRIDLQRDTDGGTWSLIDGVLTDVQGRERKTARLTIPVMPTGNYEFEFTFNRIEGTQEFDVMFPACGHGAQLVLGGFTGQSSLLEGVGEARARNDLVRIINEKPQHFFLTVESRGAEEASIDVKLNGVPYLTWKGKVSQLQVNGDRASRDGRTLGLSVYLSTVVQFSNLRVRALTGTIAAYVLGQ